MDGALQIGRAQREREGWTADDLEPIVKRCGGHPLALELLASQIPRLGPKRVLDELSKLLAGIKQDSPEARNRGMWASLDFSIRHLTDETRAALPSVALLSGGCLPAMAPMVVGLEGDAWQRVRTELERTGLVRVEAPYFRPHPVLGELVGPVGVPPSGGDKPAKAGTPTGTPALEITPEAEERFIGIVRSVADAFDELVRTPESRGALEAMAGMEVVVRRAIDRALACGRPQPAWAVAHSLRVFLEFAGRGSEGAALMIRVDERMGSAEGEISKTAASAARESAWARAAADPQSAVDDLTRLLDQLSRVRGWDTRWQRADTLMTIGRVYGDLQRRPGEAIKLLEQAVELFAKLEADGKSDTANRAVAMHDLAYNLSALGRFEEALQAAEDALELDRRRDDRLVAARDECQIAQILAQQGRYREAEERYRAQREAEPLAAAALQRRVRCRTGRRPRRSFGVRRLVAAFCWQQGPQQDRQRCI